MFRIAELEVGGGWIGVSPIPGRSGGYAADLSAIVSWGADMVLTMVTAAELSYVGAGSLGEDLAAEGVDWRHLPVSDMGAPAETTAALWVETSRDARAILSGGGRVLAHCFGGCGRAGMAAMRLMVESGEDADPALERLREVRACAVQSEAQRAWAAMPMYERSGWTP